ncbi:GNAT family N-acetyltransferase [Antarctobacter sp.]|uniref:GNAT family N-acetyltransferase n=1 Tax=Antarctobacter sp. TaxID=1872577 RepID=UPI003A91CFE4
MTRFCPVTRACLRPLCALEVHPAQRDFVAPSAVTIAQQAYEPGSTILGLWEGDTAVGLMSMIHFGLPEAAPDPDSGISPDMFYLWRLIIDKDHQGKGHGQAALHRFLDLARASGQGRAALSVVDAPASALPLYQRHGFRRTGHTSNGEALMARAL